MNINGVLPLLILDRFQSEDIAKNPIISACPAFVVYYHTDMEGGINLANFSQTLMKKKEQLVWVGVHAQSGRKADRCDCSPTILYLVCSYSRVSDSAFCKLLLMH